MKNVTQLLFHIFLGCFLFMSCNDTGSSSSKVTSDKNADTSSTSKNYPYSIKHPDNWNIGNTQNTYNALSALKQWENKNIDESMKYFADSVHIQFDGIDRKISHDSLRVMITPDSTMKNRHVNMQDWVSVVSKDKSEEYVTLWYREFMENDKGIQDSMDVINDLKMKDGKIVALDQYVRKLHP